MLALLESAPVREKFGIEEVDLELIRHWVEEVRIRWGEDEQQRAALGLPAWPENSWRHGLDRLLLGYAMAAHGEKLFRDVLPFDDIEGGAADVLGNFVEFLERLFGTLKAELEGSNGPIGPTTIFLERFESSETHQIKAKPKVRLDQLAEKLRFDLADELL